jgi:hypothetical protein
LKIAAELASPYSPFNPAIVFLKIEIYLIVLCLTAVSASER